MSDYEKVYSQKSDEELLRLARNRTSLIEGAREAFDAELQRRGGEGTIRARMKESPRIEPVDKAGADIISDPPGNNRHNDD